MGTIARGTKSATGTVNFGASTLAKASEVNTDLNTIVTVINGNLENVNIKSGAAIAASKVNLATIAQNIQNTGTLDNIGAVNITGSLTCDSLQLTGATIITSILDEDDMASNSAVALPTQQSVKAYVDAVGGSMKIGTFTRDMTDSSGDVAYTGVGFEPSVIHLFGAVDGKDIATIGGVSDGTNHYCTFDQNGVSAGTYGAVLTECIRLIEATGKSQTAVVKTMDADGFTLTWTKAGSTAAGTAYINYIAYR